jgi:hypothetical protein
MALAALSIDLTAKVAQFEGDLGKAARATEKMSADMRAALGTVSAAFGGLAGAVSVGFVSQLVTASIDAVDALNDVSDATGASVENISALQDVAARTGTSFEAVETSLLKLNSVLNDATPGSKQEAILRAIGLSATDLRKLDPAEAVLEVSKALAQYEDDGDKARLVQELFGKSAKDLAPLLKDLADKGELVATVTKEQAAEAEKFNKALAGMKADMAGATRQLVSGFLPAATNVVAALSDLQVGQRALGGVGSLVATSFEAIAVTGANVAFVFEGIGREIGAIAAQTVALAKGDIAGFNAISEAVKADAVAARAELDAFEARILGLGAKVSSIKGADSSAAKPSVGNVPVDDKDAKAAAARARSERERALKAEQDFRIKLGRDYAIEQGARVQAENEQYQKGIEQVSAAYQVFADARTEAAFQDLGAIAKNNEVLAQQVEEIGLTAEALDKLRLKRMDDAIAQQESTRATAEANGLSYEEISALEQKIELLKQQRELMAQGQIKQAAADSKKEAEAVSKEFADTMRSDLKGAFSAAFRDSSGDPLKAFGDALENMIFTRAATALSEAAFEAASGAFSGSSSGGIGDFLGSILSFDGGGSTGNGARSGGLDGKGGFMAMLHPQETVLDHTKGQSGTAGSGVTVVQNINIDSRSDQATIMGAMQRAKSEVLSTIQQSRRAGGVFA